MKLIPRRKKSPTPLERATGFVKLGVKGLVVQRAARRIFKIYKFFRRAIPLAALAAIGAAIAKKVRGGDGPDATGGYTPPQTGGGNVAGSGPSAGTSAAAAATAATGTPPVNGDAASPAAPEAVADSGGKEAAAPGVGDEQTGGGKKADSAYDSAEKGETPTDGDLEVEGPNESTPPPPEKTKK